MDAIPFEKLSVEQAVAGRKEGAVAAPANARDDRLAERNAGGTPKVKVNKDVMAWLASLPQEVRPRALAIQFPRIFNRIAELWTHQLRCEEFLNELLIDKRGTRKGFPPDVAQELVTLKIYFVKTSTIQHFDVWGERIGE
jgi:hypothetical protein